MEKIELFDRDSNGELTLSQCVDIAVRGYLRNRNINEISGIYDQFISEVEKPFIKALLEKSRYNQSLVSRASGLFRHTVRERIKKYELMEY